MTHYRNKEELESIMSALWDDIFNDPNIVTKVSSEKLIIKFQYSDFQNELFIDLSEVKWLVRKVHVIGHAKKDRRRNR